MTYSENEIDERHFIVSQADEDVRLDIFLVEKTDLTRSYIHKLIKDENVYIDSKPPKKAGVKLICGQMIDVILPPPIELDIRPERMELSIVYEDDDVILIDKPKGMVVHPAAGHYEHTLVNGLMYHCREHLSGINGVLRPGIVHRIDKDTTGIIIACKNDAAHIHLSEQFAAHSITRRYQAIAYHNFRSDDGTVDTYINRDPKDRKKMAVSPKDNSKRAITHYHVLDHLDNSFNHIELRLETGRTHQIRVHMAYINHPLLGDTVYGPKPDKRFSSLEGQTLHAGVLGFVHPTTNQYMEFSSELPQYFVSLINTLKNK